MPSPQPPSQPAHYQVLHAEFKRHKLHIGEAGCKHGADATPHTHTCTSVLVQKGQAAGIEGNTFAIFMLTW